MDFDPEVTARVVSVSPLSDGRFAHIFASKKDKAAAEALATVLRDSGADPDARVTIAAGSDAKGRDTYSPMLLSTVCLVP